MATGVECRSGRSEQAIEALGPAAIFDGPSLFARAWFAARGSDMYTGLTQCDAAACAGIKMLCGMLGPYSGLPFTPKRMLFCWDGAARKSDKPRDPKPEGYKDDMQYFMDLLSYLFKGVAQVVAPAEADDAVATAAYRVVATGAKVVVVSGDKDLQQLQRQNIHYYCLNKHAELKSEAICTKWTIYHPREVAVALAVIGDPKDGIKGVHKWGKKKFESLRKKFDRDIPLSDLVDSMAASLGGELEQQFLESLSMTILQSTVPGIPEPSEFVLADLERFDKVKGLKWARTEWASLVPREAMTMGMEECD